MNEVHGKEGRVGVSCPRGGVLARFLSLLPCLGGAPSAAQHLSAEEDEGTTVLLGGASR